MGILKSRGDTPYHQGVTAWLGKLRGNWDAVLAFSLAWAAVAIRLGPGYYFLFLYLLGCAYIIRMALKR